MRFATALTAAFLLGVFPASSQAMSDRPPDARHLADLQAKVQAASPREQPFLYAELVHSMTDIAAEQYRTGHDKQASASLLQARTYAQLIHRTLLRDAKRLRNAEILVRHTAFRLRQLLMGGGVRDRPTVEATIHQLNQVQAEMLSQEFRK